MLRSLQDGEVEPLGAAKTLTVDRELAQDLERYYEEALGNSFTAQTTPLMRTIPINRRLVEEWPVAPYEDVLAILDQQTDAWGIKVSNVELKHVDLDESMVRAIARQAEEERSRRAKVIHAEGELQASERLSQAAKILSTQPQSLQLRYLQTLT